MITYYDYCGDEIRISQQYEYDSVQEYVKLLKHRTGAVSSVITRMKAMIL